MRLLGVDYGSVRVGLALGDTETGLAGPWNVLSPKSEQHLIELLQEVIKQEKIDRVVVGVPYPASDQTRETDQTRLIRRFVQKLADRGLDVVEQNESHSSRLAAKQVIEMGERGKRDDLAAAAILQGYLDVYGRIHT